MRRVLRVGVIVQHERHHERRAHVRRGRVRPGLAQHLELRVDLVPDDAQLRREALHREGLEHVADNIVLDGLLGVLEIVVAAQERDVHRRAHLAHLTRQLDA